MGSQLVGEKAPNFTLPSSTDEMVSLADYDGKWKVLFFYVVLYLLLVFLLFFLQNAAKTPPK